MIPLPDHRREAGAGGQSRGIGRRLRLAAWTAAFLAFAGAPAVVRPASSSPPTGAAYPSEKEAEAEAARGLDGRPERGKPVSRRVSAEELYDAYSQIRSEYDAKAFRVRDDDKGGGGEGWDVIREASDGIQIAMLSHPSDPSCPYVRMRAVMPGSVEEVWDFLRLDNWERTMPSMDPFYEGLTVLDRRVHRNVDMVLARKRTKRILAFGKRDFTFVSVSDVPREDGVWVSGTVSVVTPRFPRERGYTRAFQDSVAFYEPLPPDPATGEGRTRLTIVCRIDLNDSGEGGEGGAVPMWIYVRTIGVSGVASMQSMRKQLILDRKERQARKEERERERRRRRRLLEGKEGQKDPPMPCPLFPWMAAKIRRTVATVEEGES